MDSTIRINNLVNYAKNTGHSAVMLCDHNVLFGMPEFLKECNNKKIKAIMALEVDISFEEKISSLVVIAKDSTGLNQLIRISSIISCGKGYIDLDELLRLLNHNIVVVYGEGGLIESDLINNNYDEIIRKIEYIRQKSDDMYVALSYMDSQLWKERNNYLKKICKEIDVKTVAVNKNYYLKENDWAYYKAIRGIKENKKIDDPSLTSIKGRYFLSEEEMKQLYEEDDLACTNEINDKCYGNYVFEKANLPLPKFVGENDPKKYLRKLCEVGLQKRLNNKVDDKYNRRLDYELNIIFDKNFENYFLIVYDIVRYAKKEAHIKVGPGRGSANGSLVSYCLGITEIDPIKYNILFERFLNKERSSMPDIDIDVERNRRDELVDYLKSYYGSDYVMPAIIFNTYKERSSLIDAGKYLGYSDELVARVTSRIPNDNSKTSLKEIVEGVSGFKEFIESDERYMNLFRYAYNIEGLIRSFSKHVSAIILSDRDVKNIIPIINDDGLIESQISGDYLEDFNILKIDLLSSIIMENINNIEKSIKKDYPSFNLENIPLDDPKVYKMLGEGKTLGIFQLESNLQKSLLREVKPESFNELVALMGLMRPAAKDSIPTYIKNKNNKANISYPSNELKPILDNTYGVMVFQDQAILASSIAANYTIYEADRLRSAFKNQDDKFLNNLHNEFVERCIKNSYEKEVAEDLFLKVRNFGTYGFNRSHAVSYATVAYRISYLKVNYPLYYYCERINSCIGDYKTTFELVLEARMSKVKLLAPNINISEDNYVVKNNALIIPLRAIKGVTSDLALNIINERIARGNYTSLFNFVGRILLQNKLTSEVIHNLISSGALDSFGTNRETMHNCVADALSYAELIQVNNDGVKSVNFNLVSEPIPVSYTVNKKERVNNEVEVLGFNLGELPITEVRRKYNINLPVLDDIRNIFNKNINGFACVDRIEKKTIKGFEVVNLNIYDESGSIILSLWLDKYERYASELRKGSYIKFNGTIKRENIIYGDIVAVINESE